MKHNLTQTGCSWRARRGTRAHTRPRGRLPPWTSAGPGRRRSAGPWDGEPATGWRAGAGPRDAEVGWRWSRERASDRRGYERASESFCQGWVPLDASQGLRWPMTYGRGYESVAFVFFFFPFTSSAFGLPHLASGARASRKARKATNGTRKEEARVAASPSNSPPCWDLLVSVPWRASYPSAPRWPGTAASCFFFLLLESPVFLVS
jgi:hypothetical protein